jgi:hypothetical protein
MSTVRHERLKAQEQRRNGTRTHYLWGETGESLYEVRKRFWRILEEGRAPENDVTSSCAGNGHRSALHPQFPALSLFRPLLFFRSFPSFARVFAAFCISRPPFAGIYREIRSNKDCCIPSPSVGQPTETCSASSRSICECIDDHHPAAADHHCIEQRSVKVKRQTLDQCLRDEGTRKCHGADEQRDRHRARAHRRGDRIELLSSES